MTDVELAYLAGILDGEGSIGAYAPAYILQVQVVGADRRPLDLFQEAFGGGVYDKGVRVVVGRPRFRQWSWDVSGHRARAVLIALLPYLRVKREQADAALRIPLAEVSHPLTPEQRSMRQEIAALLKTMKRAYEPAGK